MEIESRRGTWWIAGHEAMKAPGTLGVVDEHIVLDLAGVLFRPLAPGEEDNFATPIDRIVGVDEHGKHCALLHCLMTQFEMQSSGAGSMSFVVSMVVRGEDDSIHSTAAFSELSFEIDALSELYSPSTVSVEEIGDPMKVEGVELKSVFREKLSAELDDRSISLVPGVSLKGGLATEPIVLKHSVSARVELRAPEAVDTMVNAHIKPILNLVRLGVDRQVEVTAMKVREGDSRWADVYYMAPSLHTGSKQTTRNVLFVFEPDQFSDMLARWLDSSERFAVVFDLYFATAYGSPMYAESRFLALAQAIEAYDRIANPTPEAERDVYASRRDAVSKQLNAADRAWLKKATLDPQHIEASARKRFDRTLRRYQKYLGFNSDRRGSLVHRILETRNFLTHWDDRRAANAAEGAELFYLSSLLRTTLRGLLLEEAGVDIARLPRHVWSR